MNVNIKNYKCAICGREHSKLWRPYMDVEPLICATCAEEMQSSMEYDEVVWEKDGTTNGYIGNPTGVKLPLPRWTINDDGKIPSYNGPGPDGLPDMLTDQLIVDLSNKFKNYSSGHTTIIPAVPYGNDGFWGYTAVPEDLCEWWRKLPTR